MDVWMGRDGCDQHDRGLSGPCASMSKSGGAHELIHGAGSRFCRDQELDDPTKVGQASQSWHSALERYLVYSVRHFTLPMNASASAKELSFHTAGCRAEIGVGIMERARKVKVLVENVWFQCSFEHGTGGGYVHVPT